MQQRVASSFACCSSAHPKQAWNLNVFRNGEDSGVEDPPPSRTLSCSTRACNAWRHVMYVPTQTCVASRHVPTQTRKLHIVADNNQSSSLMKMACSWKICQGTSVPSASWPMVMTSFSSLLSRCVSSSSAATISPGNRIYS